MTVGKLCFTWIGVQKIMQPCTCFSCSNTNCIHWARAALGSAIPCKYASWPRFFTISSGMLPPCMNGWKYCGCNVSCCWSCKFLNCSADMGSCDLKLCSAAESLASLLSLSFSSLDLSFARSSFTIITSESCLALSSDPLAFWYDATGWGLFRSGGVFGTAKERDTGDFDLPYGEGVLIEVSLFLSLLIWSLIPEVLIPGRKEMNAMINNMYSKFSNTAWQVVLSIQLWRMIASEAKHSI